MGCPGPSCFRGPDRNGLRPVGGLARAGDGRGARRAPPANAAAPRGARARIRPGPVRWRPVLYAKARKEFHLAEQPLQVTPVDRAMNVTIEPYYRNLQGPLVILGEPGTGKTTLLHELATALCSANESDPIPVPFGLSNWALKEQPLAEWMVSELRRNYGVGSELAKSWVSREVVLPFFDGLDEVPAANRNACEADQR